MENLIFQDLIGLTNGEQIIGTWGGKTNPDEESLHYGDLPLSEKFRLAKL